MTTFYERTTDVYDACQDQAERYPEWRIGACKVMPSGGEVIIADHKMFRFAFGLWQQDEEWCRAHAIAHFDLAEEGGGDPAAIDCDFADALARIRLDREGSR